MFNMAKVGHLDYEFFDELDSQMNPTLLDNAYLTDRYFYGALYAYYTFNRGKAENIIFFENGLEPEPNIMHTEMSIILFEKAYDSEIVDRDRLKILIENFYKPNFLDNWDQEVVYKQRLIAEFFRIFKKVNYLDEELGRVLIDTAMDTPRFQNLDNYHKILTGMLWYHETPESPFFQKLDKELNSFRDRIRNNENRLWRYDPEVK